MVERDDKADKALEMALGQIEKQYGKGSVMKMGDKSTMAIESVPTGALALDLALGIGGLPKGRVVEIYGEAGFPIRVVDAKKDFATRYALDASYWYYNDISEAEEVVGFLKTNLTDLAGHYHALYQEKLLVDKRPANFVEANRWYRQLLGSFPDDPATPGVNYQLADLLLENEDFLDAASEYGLDTRSILVELGKRKMVGGQEDMIVDVALDMVREKS